MLILIMFQRPFYLDIFTFCLEKKSVECDNNVWVTMGAQPLCLMVGHATQSKQI
jgi:hypothetical protein